MPANPRRYVTPASESSVSRVRHLRSSHRSDVPFAESPQDRRGMVDAALPCSRFQRLSRLGSEVSVVLVDIDSRADADFVELGVKLRRVDVLAHAKSLDRAVGREGEA